MQADQDFCGSWLIYAVGGGWGHLTRAISLARIAGLKKKLLIASNSQYCQIVKASSYWQELTANRSIELCNLESSKSACNQEERKESFKSELKALLESRTFECFIVDTFPRGLLGELPDLFKLLKNTPKVFIHRDLNEDYCRSFELRSFVERNFALTINPGEGGNPYLADLAIETAAWVLKDAPEPANRNRLRSELGLKTADNLILVCSSGVCAEHEIYEEITEQLSLRFPEHKIRCLSPHALKPELEHLRICYWPGIDYFNAADLLIGAAGYNTTNESAALSLPSILLPQRRIYDRQELRSSEFSLNKNAISCLQDLIACIETLDFDNLKERRLSPKRERKNGAVEAFELILNQIKPAAVTRERER
ncbi:MAG: hypothetical protein K2X27_17065 [Candidatus Obscuribacterales bacterium]|nr:hypothetical protein [Candidatus Obscuribacterales bacterium]